MLLLINFTIFILQAEKASWNSIGIFKLSNISGKRRDLVPKNANTDVSDMESDSSDSDDDDEEEDGTSGTPVLQVQFYFYT